MSIQQNFPAISPSLNLNFARSKTLDPRITFSRTSTATRVNEQGLVEVVSADIPRFDHEYENGVIKSLGLLVEEERSNLLTYSADFNNWSKIRSYISGVNVISPDGTESANKIVEDNSLGTHYVRKLPTVSADAVCAISVYVKSAQRSQFAIHTYGSNGWNASLTAIYDLPTGNITGTNAENCTINAVGNGWYRATYIATKNSTSGTANVDFYTALNGNVSYQGDNSSGIYLWGAQLEEGAFPTSYIPTTASTATREPDRAVIEGSNFTDIFNTNFNNFSMFVNYDNTDTDDGTNYSIIQFWGESTNYDNRVEFFKDNASPYHIETRAFGGGSAIFSNGLLNASSKAATQKLATSWSVNYSTSSGAYRRWAFSFSGESVDVVNDNVGTTVPSLTRIGFGINPTRTDFDGGKIYFKQISLYSNTLTDSQLQTLTK